MWESALAAFTALLSVAAILVVRTGWFRNAVRQKIITAVAEGTGGRVEIGSFSLDWPHLDAQVTDFVIHGSEPAGAAPYLRADRVELRLTLFTSLKRPWGISYLGIDHPQANIMVLPDGTTNVPKPKQTAPTNETPLQTVVDLAVGHFDLNHGSVSFNSQKQDFSLSGEALHAQLWYNALKQGYKGEIALSPLYYVAGSKTPVQFRITLPVTLGADSIAFDNGSIATNQSQLAIDGSLKDLRDPKTSAHIRGSLALADLRNAGNLQLADSRGLPSKVDLDVNATIALNRIDVANSHIAFGASTIEAAGPLQDPSGNGSLAFQAHLALAELGRIANLQARPEGTLQANGTARMDAQHNYDVTAFVNARQRLVSIGRPADSERHPGIRRAPDAAPPGSQRSPRECLRRGSRRQRLP